MIYLDNNATMKPDAEALDFAVKQTLEHFGNPSSLHPQGVASADLLFNARKNVASALSCKSHEVCFTSGGTEANNIALAQTSLFCFVGATEHSSVYNHTRRGTIDVLQDGTIDLNQLEEVLKENGNRLTLRPWGLLSIMLANNETGVISDPTHQAYELSRKYGCLLHVDAVQGFGKEGAPWTVDGIRADMISISAHKLGGPKGIGALYVSEEMSSANSQNVRTPVFYGGSHERGLRPGTENIFGAVAFGYICKKIVTAEYQEKIEAARAWRDRLEKALDSVTQVNGNKEHRTGNTSNLYFPEVKDLELFMDTLSFKGLCVSGKSACSSGMPTPSRVLTAMYGEGDPRLDGSIRISLSSETTRTEVDQAVDIIKETLSEIQALV